MVQTMMQVFLDMDGVLADFISGICVAHGQPNPYYLPDGKVSPRAACCWDVWALLKDPLNGSDGMTLEDFWKPCDYAFWCGLPRMPEAHELTSLAISAFGLKNITIMTSPSSNDGCIEGKLAWLDEHYPALAEAVCFERNKADHAYPNGLLIDDSDHNVESWQRAGGQAILVPRPWNKRWRVAHECLDVIRSEISAIKRRQIGVVTYV